MLNRCNVIFVLLILVLISGCTVQTQTTGKEAVTVEAVVSIDPSIRYQTIEGWGEGGMDTFIPAWYTLFRPNVHEMIMDSMYKMDSGQMANGKGLGLNICRFLMPMGDAPDHDHMTNMIPLANKPFEPEDGVFTWEGHENILWRAKGAKQRGAKMWASFYSPPYWLTVSGCTGGSVDGSSNNLRAGEEPRYAKHIVDIMVHFRDEWGIDFEYVSPLNEPDANWWKAQGGSPGCHVDDKQAVVIIKALSEEMKKRNVKAKMHAHDAAYGNYYWYMENLLKSEVEPIIDVMTVHQYITSDESLKKWNELSLQYDKSLWSTEWGDWANAGYPHYRPWEQSLIQAAKIHEGLKVLKSSAWIIWETGFNYNTDMFWLQPRKSYWVIAQYSRHVRPGFVQIDSQESVAECKTTAWVNPDGDKLVLVTFNDVKGDMSVSYDLSKFGNVKVDEVIRTSKTEDYKTLEEKYEASERLVVDVPEGAVVTITASISD